MTLAILAATIATITALTITINNYINKVEAKIDAQQATFTAFAKLVGAELAKHEGRLATLERRQALNELKLHVNPPNEPHTSNKPSTTDMYAKPLPGANTPRRPQR